MSLAAAALLVQSLIVLWAGILAPSSSGSTVSLAFTGVVSAALLFWSCRVFGGSLVAGYLGGALTFLSAIYFAYRLIATEQFVPSGILLILSFLSLFGVLLGVFLGLRHRL